MQIMEYIYTITLLHAFNINIVLKFIGLHNDKHKMLQNIITHL